MIKDIFRFTVILILFIIPHPVSGQVLEQIVAVVEDEIILQSQLQQKMQLQLQQMGLTSMPPENKLLQIRKEVLASMIADEIILLKAKEDSIEINEDKVDEMLKGRQEYIKQMYGGEDNFKKDLAAQGMTEKEFKRQLREDVEKNQLKEQVMMRVAQQIHPLPAEIEEFYTTHKAELPTQPESVRVAHLLLPLLPDTTGAKQRIARVQEALAAGEDFAGLAKIHSDGPTGKNGGSLGWFSRGDMVPAFDQAVFAMQPGEISEPVLTQYGYHIIKLEEFKDNRAKASHILISVKVTDEIKEKTRARIDSIYTEIQGGLSFEDAVTRYTVDTTTRDKGGDLGWQEIDKLPQEFIAPIRALKKAEVTKPVLSPLGFHLMKLLDHREAIPLTLENNFEMIKNMVRNRKIMEELEKIVEAMKEKVYVENRLEQ